MTTSKTPREHLALALDNCAELAQIQEMVDRTVQHVGVFKVGLEQYTRFGPIVLDLIRRSNTRIFLDLKLHDIPNTVAKAVAAAAEHNIDLLTLHISGGRAMMEAAAEAAAKSTTPPRLIGVTVLTSISQQALGDELRVTGQMADQEGHLARLAMDSGLDGIVCSAVDLPAVRAMVPEGKEIVTPGIRPPGAEVQDQKRVATPRSAVAGGATLLVVGRPITAAEDPAAAAKTILLEVEASLHGNQGN